LGLLTGCEKEEVLVEDEICKIVNDAEDHEEHLLLRLSWTTIIMLTWWWWWWWWWW
jgi:hypothetical protein